MNGAQATYLPDGRLHLNHGPIDLIILAEGPGVKAAFHAAIQRFETLLEELVQELPALRSPAGSAILRGPVACRMLDASLPHASEFITPMAAVAGAVADETLYEMKAAGSLTRVAVNNGGDIAVHLANEQTMRVTLSTDLGEKLGDINLYGGDGINGVATSGRGGRSFSLGIADSVTVLADEAATADTAATMISNACDLPNHPAITRTAAMDLAPDSDLGDRLVVTACATLSEADKIRGLDKAGARAQALLTRGLIRGAAIFLQGECRTYGAAALQISTEEGRLYA